MSTHIADITLNKASGTTLTLQTAGKYVDDDLEFGLNVTEGNYYAGTSHTTLTSGIVTGKVNGSIANIATDVKPSGTDGTDYWTIKPSATVTSVGEVKAIGKAYISQSGYIAAGSKSDSESVAQVSPQINSGVFTYIEKGAVTNNTSGGTSSGTINRGSQIKIGSGYYPSDAYYTAAGNSGTMNITTSTDNGTVSVDGYANVNITGINIPKPESGTNTFSVKVPNGNTTATFVFNVDASGNVTITET